MAVGRVEEAQGLPVLEAAGDGVPVTRFAGPGVLAAAGETDWLGGFWWRDADIDLESDKRVNSSSSGSGIAAKVLLGLDRGLSI